MKLHWPSSGCWDRRNSIGKKRKTTSDENGIFIRMFPLINDLQTSSNDLCFDLLLSCIYEFACAHALTSLQFNGVSTKSASAAIAKPSSPFDFKSSNGQMRTSAHHRRHHHRPHSTNTQTRTSGFGHVSHAFASKIATAHSNLWTCCPLNFPLSLPLAISLSLSSPIAHCLK